MSDAAHDSGLVTPPGETLPETVISSRASVRFWQSLRGLWDYRELFRAFVVRELKVRYRQTALGGVWVVLQPMLASGIFVLIFRRLGVSPSEGALESLVFFMAALVPWNAFAGAVNRASTALETGADLMRKVYFPRLVAPASYVLAAGVDFLIAFAILLVLAVWLNGAVALWLVAWLPMALLVMGLASAGVGFFLAALDAQYHDVKYIVPVGLMMAMFLHVLLPLDGWGPLGQWILSWSPLVGVIEGFRDTMAGALPDVVLTAKAIGVSVLAFAFGTWFLRVRESKLVDIM